MICNLFIIFNLSLSKNVFNAEGLFSQIYFQIFDKALLRTIFEAEI